MCVYVCVCERDVCACLCVYVRMCMYVRVCVCVRVLSVCFLFHWICLQISLELTCFHFSLFSHSFFIAPPSLSLLFPIPLFSLPFLSLSFRLRNPNFLTSRSFVWQSICMSVCLSVSLSLSLALSLSSYLSFTRLFICPPGRA